MKMFRYIWIFLLVGCNEASVWESSSSNKKTTNTPKDPCIPEFRMKNVWQSNFINVNGDNAIVNNDNSPNWQFILISSATNQYYIKDGTTSKFLTENGNGGVAMSATSTTRSSWLIETVGGGSTTPGNQAVQVRIKNTTTAGYLNVENGPLTCGNILPGWLSAMWNIYGDPDGQVIFFTKTAQTCGTITIKINNTGATTLTLNTTSPNGVTSCSPTSGIVATLPVCVYDFTATCSSKSWTGTVTVNSGQCTMHELK